MINPNAKLIKGRCRVCGVRVAFLVIPMCEKCIDSRKTLSDLKTDEEFTAMIIEQERTKKRASRRRYHENVKRRKAKVLQVERANVPGVFFVSSYSDPTIIHVVTAGPEGIHGPNNDCDCHNGKHDCSHVQAARLFEIREHALAHGGTKTCQTKTRS